MPKEEFYGFATGDGGTRRFSVATSASLTVRWGDEQPRVTINGVEYDRRGLNRLIVVLRKAREQTFGDDK